MNTSSHPCLFGFLKNKSAICLLFKKKNVVRLWFCRRVPCLLIFYLKWQYK